MVAPPIGLPFRYHWLPDAALDVSVTDPPLQKVVGPPGVFVGVGGIGFTVTATAKEDVEEQPSSVTISV